MLPLPDHSTDNKDVIFPLTSSTKNPWLANRFLVIKLCHQIAFIAQSPHKNYLIFADLLPTGESFSHRHSREIYTDNLDQPINQLR